MLTKEFLCKREVLGKISPHSFTPPPPPLSVVGVSNKCLKLEETYQKKKEDVEDHSIKIIKGKESLTLDCICDDFKGKQSCDDVGKKEDIEDTSNECKESPKTLDCIDSKCDDVEFFSSEKDDLETVCVKFDDSYPMETIE
jgi:hypothetical protein